MSAKKRKTALASKPYRSKAAKAIRRIQRIQRKLQGK